MDGETNLGRRRMLGMTLATFTAGLARPSLAPSGSSASLFSFSNPVVAENQRPGSTAWEVTQSANDLDKQIKGYASATSVSLGGLINFHVSVNRAQTYTIDFYRIGWYRGAGGRLMASSGRLSGKPQRYNAPNPTTGLIEENWPVSHTLWVPLNWTSGVYVAKLTNAEGWQNYVTFVVRDDWRSADLLYQRSVTTDQAYNNFPNVDTDNPRFNPADPTHIGKSLYDSNSHGANTVSGGPQAVKVSFDRPYADDGSGKFFVWEADQIRWLERMGYDVVYSTNLDTHTNGRALQRYQGFISAGHDEYWSYPMRDAVENARDRGVNLAFFGANACYWRVRFEPSGRGVANRVMVCYKDASIDPTRKAGDKTILFRDLGRPEQTLVGIQYVTFGASFDVNTPWRPINTDHWLFDHSGVKPGDAIDGLVGYEIDRLDPDYPKPAHRSHTLLGASPYLDFYGDTVTANSSIYQAPSGAWVFASGTLSWSWGLDKGDTGVDDARIQRISRNLLDRFVSPRWANDPDDDDFPGWHRARQHRPPVLVGRESPRSR